MLTWPSVGSTNDEHPPGLWWYHRPDSMAWPPVAAETSDNHMNFRLQHGIGQQHRPQKYCEEIPIQNNNYSSCQTSFHCSELDWLCSWPVCLGAESSQAPSTPLHLADVFLHWPQSLLTPASVTAAVSVQLLSTTHFPPSFPVSIAYLFVVVIFENSVCQWHNVLLEFFFFPKQLYMQISIAKTHWSGSRFLLSNTP